MHIVALSWFVLQIAPETMTNLNLEGTNVCRPPAQLRLHDCMCAGPEARCRAARFNRGEESYCVEVF